MTGEAFSPSCQSVCPFTTNHVSGLCLLAPSLWHSARVEHQRPAGFFERRQNFTRRETWVLVVLCSVSEGGSCLAPAQIPEARKILRDAAWLPLQICFCFCQVALRQHRETTRQTGLFVLLLWACRLCGILLRSLGRPSQTHLLNHFLQTELYVICLDKIISTRVRLLNTQFDLCLHLNPLCSQSWCFLIRWHFNSAAQSRSRFKSFFVYLFYYLHSLHMYLYKSFRLVN